MVVLIRDSDRSWNMLGAGGNSLELESEDLDWIPDNCVLEQVT